MGRHAIYPYREWMDGEWHNIKVADYGKSIPSLRQILHQYARENRHKLVSRKLDDETLAVCFIRVPV